jgi:hypothetical protein
MRDRGSFHERSAQPRRGVPAAPPLPRSLGWGGGGGWGGGIANAPAYASSPCYRGYLCVAAGVLSASGAPTSGRSHCFPARSLGCGGGGMPPKGLWPAAEPPTPCVSRVCGCALFFYRLSAVRPAPAGGEACARARYWGPRRTGAWFCFRGSGCVARLAAGCVITSCHSRAESIFHCLAFGAEEERTKWLSSRLRRCTAPPR